MLLADVEKSFDCYIFATFKATVELSVAFPRIVFIGIHTNQMEFSQPFFAIFIGKCLTASKPIFVRFGYINSSIAIAYFSQQVNIRYNHNLKPARLLLKIVSCSIEKFCCLFIVIALRASPPQNNKNIARNACRLLFMWNGWYSLIGGCGDRVISIARLSACAFRGCPREVGAWPLPSNPVIPTKPIGARRCQKTSFCFLCLTASSLAKQRRRKQK